MQTSTTERGVTLIELLVSIAVLSIVLAGIYTLLNSAFQTYLSTRRRSESQQTAKAVTDYVVQRLREIDGGRTVDDPWNCTGCHTPNIDLFYPDYTTTVDIADTLIPCPQNVTIPNRSLALLDLKTNTLPTLASVPANYQNMDGNYIQFQADLLPLHGFSETFTDKDGDGVWDWTDGLVDGTTNGAYDLGEGEYLIDMNENNKLDSFSEIWTLQVRASADGGPYYELVESLNFTSLQPRERSALNLDDDGNEKLKYNRSVHPDSGYSTQVVAYGLVGLSIKRVPRVLAPGVTTNNVQSTCGGGNTGGTFPAKGCHGANATGGAKNIYDNHSSFDYAKFLETHEWWNTKALSVEVATSSTTGLKEHYTKYKQFVIPRNLEVNRYAK